MPDISASLGLLDATFFLYHSVEDAEAGTQYGGAGVIVGVPLESRPDLCVRYAVSNWHVVCDQGASVIRLSLPNGKTHIIDKDPSEWTFLPGRADLAAVALYLPPDVQPSVVPVPRFIGIGERSDAHTGDDVFMVGRFVDFDGHETNIPATRFGHISMMSAPVRQMTGYNGPSVIVDMHSRAGFSGSPVYVYRPGNVTQLPFTIQGPNADKIAKMKGPPASHRKWGIGNNTEVRLLGIHWGQFPEKWEIKAIREGADKEASLITEGAYVAGLSGMTCVIPASEILTLLDHDELKGPRDALEKPGALDAIPQGEGS